ncbi:MAG TPA: zinc ribbon domain-containing protein [Thermoplasmata archaeon]|jgi:hypothetical protein
MADGIDLTTIIIVVLVIIMTIVVWFELRYLRKSNRNRRGRAAKRAQELPDEAHNALITTRAIVSTLADRSGIENEEVTGLMREAQMAYDRRNYRVTIELTTKAKERLMVLKGQHAAKGDLAKLESIPAGGTASEEPTTKELLQRDFPPNMLQARFSISMAESSVEGGRVAGRDTSQAETLLSAAKARYDAKDYSGALTVARQAERSAAGETIVVSIPSAPAPPVPPVPADVPESEACSSCGAPMREGDIFCRKCGARVVPTKCPSCGADLLADDMFCRKCGTRIPR